MVYHGDTAFGEDINHAGAYEAAGFREFEKIKRKILCL